MSTKLSVLRQYYTCASCVQSASNVLRVYIKRILKTVRVFTFGHFFVYLTFRIEILAASRRYEYTRYYMATASSFNPYSSQYFSTFYRDKIFLIASFWVVFFFYKFGSFHFSVHSLMSRYLSRFTSRRFNWVTALEIRNRKRFSVRRFWFTRPSVSRYY